MPKLLETSDRIVTLREKTKGINEPYYAKTGL